MPRRNKPQKQAQKISMVSCEQKRKFSSQAIAQDALELRELQAPSVELAIYKCASCSGWHLTSKKS